MFVFICEMILQLYPSWCQITLLTKSQNLNMACLSLDRDQMQPNYTGAERNSFFGRVLATKVTAKKSGPRHIYCTPIMQKKLGPFWYIVDSNIQTPIEGRHPVLYFITQILEGFHLFHFNDCQEGNGLCREKY